MGDDSPRTASIKIAHNHNRPSPTALASSALAAFVNGPKRLASVNPGHHLFPKLVLPAEFSDFQRFCCIINHTFSVPDCVAGQVVFVLENSAILVVVAAYCVSSSPQYRSPSADVPPAFWYIDVVCAAVFLFDYVVRLLTCFALPWESSSEHNLASSEEKPCYASIPGALRNLLYFLVSPLNVVDAVSVFPAIATFAYGNTAVAQHLLVLRVLRLALLSRGIKIHEDSGITMISHALYKSADVLLFLLFIFGVTGTFFSAAVFFCEAGAWNHTLQAFVRPDEASESPFKSLPHSMWWTLSTMSTVGYGDVVTTTPCGKAVGTVVILSGVLAIALPIAVIVNAFGKEYDARVARQRAKAKANLSRRIEGDLTAPSPHISLAPLDSDLAGTSRSYYDDLVSKDGASLSRRSIGTSRVLPSAEQATQRGTARSRTDPAPAIRANSGAGTSESSMPKSILMPSRRTSYRTMNRVGSDVGTARSQLETSRNERRSLQQTRAETPVPSEPHCGVVGVGDSQDLLSTLLQESREMRAAIQTLNDQVAALSKSRPSNAAFGTPGVVSYPRVSLTSSTSPGGLIQPRHPSIVQSPSIHDAVGGHEGCRKMSISRPLGDTFTHAANVTGDATDESATSPWVVNVLPTNS